VERWAAELGVDDNGLLLVRDLAANAQARATADFYRLNWIGDGDPQDDPHFQELLAHYGSAAYALTVEADPAITARWQALADCPAGSLGQALHGFYQERGFCLPGVVGSGNEALAQHDWIHVITGYGTTPLGEMQVTASWPPPAHPPAPCSVFSEPSASGKRVCCAVSLSRHPTTPP
jgi:hypothetical protein